MRQLGRLFATAAMAICVLGAPAPAAAAPGSVTIQASIVKPLVLTWLRDLNLGSIVLGPGSWSGATIGISRTGTFTCTNPNVTCSGATQTAGYNVSGTNNRVVRISAPNVTLVNQDDPSASLTLVVDSPGSVTLTNSGPPGTNFALGGSVTVNSATPGGLYVGTFNVTVDY